MVVNFSVNGLFYVCVFALCSKTEPTLLVLSMDGFRADYLLRNMTPTLDFLSRCGVHAPYMRAVFPTKTFPNHYTLATV